MTLSRLLVRCSPTRRTVPPIICAIVVAGLLAASQITQQQHQTHQHHHQHQQEVTSHEQADSMDSMPIGPRQSSTGMRRLFPLTPPNSATGVHPIIPVAVGDLDPRRLAVYAFHYYCHPDSVRTEPVLATMRLWAAKWKAEMPHATTVAAMSRDAWTMWIKEEQETTIGRSPGSTDGISLVDDCAPVPRAVLALSPFVPSPFFPEYSAAMGSRFPSDFQTYGVFAPSRCPLKIDMIIFIDDLPSATLTPEEQVQDKRHPWMHRACFSMWRDRLRVTQLLQSARAAFHSVLVSDVDTWLCDGSRLEAALETLRTGVHDSASIMAPVLYGGGIVPYLPKEAVERNCGVIAFGTHDSSRALTQAWSAAFYKQVMLCPQCQLSHDQSGYREAVYRHYTNSTGMADSESGATSTSTSFALGLAPTDQAQRAAKENILRRKYFCRNQGNCQTGCILVHRHATPRDYTGDSSQPSTPGW